MEKNEIIKSGYDAINKSYDVVAELYNDIKDRAISLLKACGGEIKFNKDMDETIYLFKYFDDMDGGFIYFKKAVLNNNKITFIVDTDEGYGGEWRFDDFPLTEILYLVENMFKSAEL